ncbi:hypothetical protein PQX77_010311 [Marasmius sp. AFHP31]|nr:hypothetical protein PQX77_010311 [Marasmius sp. AFHP31]
MASTRPKPSSTPKPLPRARALGSPDDFASPGYFSTNLLNSICVELASTRRTALRYTFPAESITPRILLDVTNDGQISGVDPEMSIDPETGRMAGSFKAEVVSPSPLRSRRSRRMEVSTDVKPNGHEPSHSSGS